jgi:hypothetical protein
MSIYIFYCILSVAVWSQEGVVVTNTDSIKGTITVNLEQNLVIIRQDNSYESMYANRVKEVIAIEDEIPVKYVSSVYGSDQKDLLFRVLSEGKLTLVYRPKILKNPIEKTYYADFHVYENGKIIRTLETEKDVLKLMSDHKQSIREYLSVNIFFVDNDVMLKEIFDYYNKL